jgi:hypothetical protein
MSGHIVSVRSLMVEVISVTAPEELPGAEIYLCAYLDDPSVLDLLLDGRDDATGLGEGVDQFAQFATLAAAFTVGALGKGVGKALEEWSTATTRSVAGRLRKRLGRRGPVVPEPTPLPPLTPEQLAEIRHACVAVLKNYKCNGRRAELLADAIVGRLAATTDEQQE